MDQTTWRILQIIWLLLFAIDNPGILWCSSPEKDRWSLDKPVESVIWINNSSTWNVRLFWDSSPTTHHSSGMIQLTSDIISLFPSQIFQWLGAPVLEMYIITHIMYIYIYIHNYIDTRYFYWFINNLCIYIYIMNIIRVCIYI